MIKASMKNGILFCLIVFTAVAVLPSCRDRQKEADDSKLLKKAVAICQDNIVLDSHIDWPMMVTEFPEDISKQATSGDFDYVRAAKGGLNAVLSVAYIYSGHDVEKGRNVFDSVIMLVEHYTRDYPDKFAAAVTPADVRRNFEKKLLSLPVCLENGSPIGDDIGYLEYLKEKGIVYICLNHSRTNQISDSNFDENRQWNGLSPFGIEVIKEMNRLGIIIDISHSTDSTVYQALRYSAAPIIASHSLCRHFMPGLERNLPDTLIKAIADKNGVVMVNFGSFFLEPETGRNWTYIFNEWSDSTGIDVYSEEGINFIMEYGKNHRLRSTAEKVAEHIDHIVRLAGIDHVGIGSDFDGILFAQPTDIPDVSGYPALVLELLRKGYSEDDLRKILAGNFLRVWTEVLETAESVD